MVLHLQAFQMSITQTWLAFLFILLVYIDQLNSIFLSWYRFRYLSSGYLMVLGQLMQHHCSPSACKCIYLSLLWVIFLQGNMRPGIAVAVKTMSVVHCDGVNVTDNRRSTEFSSWYLQRSCIQHRLETLELICLLSTGDDVAAYWIVHLHLSVLSCGHLHPQVSTYCWKIPGCLCWLIIYICVNIKHLLMVSRKISLEVKLIHRMFS